MMSLSSPNPDQPMIKMSMTPTHPFHHIQRRGLMLVLSSPSGAGKTTIARQLLAGETNLVMSVSVTTRSRRPNEVDHKDYHFLDTAIFEQMRDKGELLEHAQVFGNYYGTPREPVEQALKQGQDVLFDIDWQGTQQVREAARHDLVSIFILPPSWEELERRLKSRAQDSSEVVTHRMAQANAEMSHWAEYDYIVINSEVHESLTQVRAILHSERLKRERQLGLSDFVKKFCTPQR